jgi:hypothetical protein
MAGNSGFDNRLPASFKVLTPRNVITGNVAAGSERLGWDLYGMACSAAGNGTSGSGDSRFVFENNVAHTSLVGMILRASDESMAEGCTAVNNFHEYQNWDFGILTVKGIPTNVLLRGFRSLNPKHAGVLILRVRLFLRPTQIA